MCVSGGCQMGYWRFWAFWRSSSFFFHKDCREDRRLRETGVSGLSGGFEIDFCFFEFRMFHIESLSRVFGRAFNCLRCSPGEGVGCHSERSEESVVLSTRSFSRNGGIRMTIRTRGDCPSFSWILIQRSARNATCGSAPLSDRLYLKVPTL